MVILKFLILIIIFFTLNIPLFAQTFSIKGQSWASALTNNDVPLGQSSLEYNIGYIPTFSLNKTLLDNYLIDMELSFQLNRTYSGESLINNTEIFYRYWVRYSSSTLEARLGLQKVSFGPAQILRTLSWFDTINLRDPTGQTHGVEAFRLKWFPSNVFSLWSWMMTNNQNNFSYGGRGELSTKLGEWGFTYHQDPSTSLQMMGQSSIPVSDPHYRLAIDYRYDGFIGLWNESAMIKSENLTINMVTLGADYTLPILNGILLMTEALYISTKPNLFTLPRTFSAFMASLPLGILHNVMLISSLDWDKNYIYNYLRWNTTFDSFSINCMASINPKEMGNSIQFMFIYNH